VTQRKRGIRTRIISKGGAGRLLSIWRLRREFHPARDQK
jgi:hypothetical protein